jgi:hypothetical protein
MDCVLSLSQYTCQGYLVGGSVILLANLLQTVCRLEDTGKVLLGAPRDAFTEVAVLEVIRVSLRRIQRAISRLLCDC